MRKTIKGKITVQTIMYLLVALVICELVSVVTLNANMTSQSKLYKCRGADQCRCRERVAD